MLLLKEKWPLVTNYSVNHDMVPSAAAFFRRSLEPFQTIYDGKYTFSNQLLNILERGSNPDRLFTVVKIRNKGCLDMEKSQINFRIVFK